MLRLYYTDLLITSNEWRIKWWHMNEEWKDIPGFNGFYQISNWGRVQRHAYSYEDKTDTVRYVDGGYQKIKVSSSGYHYTKIGKKLKLQLHKLVARAFLGKPRKGQVITHLDGNRDNNHADNLKYVTKAKAWKLAQKRKSRITRIEITIKE